MIITTPRTLFVKYCKASSRNETCGTNSSKFLGTSKAKIYSKISMVSWKNIVLSNRPVYGQFVTSEFSEIHFNQICLIIEAEVCSRVTHRICFVYSACGSSQLQWKLCSNRVFCFSIRSIFLFCKSPCGFCLQVLSECLVLSLPELLFTFSSDYTIGDSGKERKSSLVE